MADPENDTIEDLPEEKEKKKSGGSPWMPVIVVVVLLPILSIAMTEFYLFPKMKGLAQEVRTEHKG